MRKTRILAAIGLIVAVSAGCTAAERADGPPRNIILVGWDGCQREHLEQALERGELPVLKQLASEGRLVKIDMRGTTDTKAGWSQILTGYDPGVTGVYSNGRYQPVPEGYSVFERLEKHFGPEEFVTVAVIGKKAHCGEIDPPQKRPITAQRAAAIQEAQAEQQAARKKAAAAKKATPKEAPAAPKPKAKAKAKRARPLPPGGRLVEEDGKFFIALPGKPYANMHKACDQWLFGLQQDEKVGTKAIELLDQYKDKPLFFFVHFAEIDHSGHAHGENSKEYNDAIISADTWTGKIIEKLKALGLYEKTLIYVTADHGFDEDKTGHRKAPYVFLGTNDPKVCRDGDRADVTPTIYDRFGLDVGKCAPPLAGRSLLRPAQEAKAN